MIIMRPMDLPDTKPRQERVDTDASLLAERLKTDTELVSRETAVQEAENEVVEVARKRAQETLRAARERANAEMGLARATPELQKKVAAERSNTDEVVAEEQAAADERLRLEREDRRRALNALLCLEREATDEGLLVERARADEVVATRDDFLGMVSHDLRSILGSIALSAELLTQLPVVEGSPALGHALRIQRSTARMNRLVGDLLDVVCLEAGQLRIAPLSQDAREVARGAVDAFLPSFSAKGVALTLDIPDDAVVATFDHERILQVLANLLSNALRFTPRGGHVALSLAVARLEVQFSVTDTGAGIPAEQVSAIFERFGQVTRDRRGHGLGLYIAKCIVLAHEGRVWAERSDAGGAVLRFTLPQAGASAVAHTANVAS